MATYDGMQQPHIIVYLRLQHTLKTEQQISLTELGNKE